MIKERRELVRGLYAYVKRLNKDAVDASNYMFDHDHGTTIPKDLDDLVKGVFVSVAKLTIECQKYLPEEDEEDEQ